MPLSDLAALRRLLEDEDEDTFAFSDDELETYLSAAGEQWTRHGATITQAAVYAIDTLLMGTATALDFGAGQETFDMQSVHRRLIGLREAYVDTLAALPAFAYSEPS